MMTYLPVILFAIAAVGGLTLAIIKFSGKELPWSIVIGHGVFAASGLVALIVNALQTGQNSLTNVAVILFLITAVGGFTVLGFHLTKKTQPAPLIIVHGLAAVISFVVLLFAVFK